MHGNQPRGQPKYAAKPNQVQADADQANRDQNMKKALLWQHVEKICDQFNQIEMSKDKNLPYNMDAHKFNE